MRFTLKLDVHNPAEFYAALGFLELVSQQGDSVTSHFESEGSTGANSTFLLLTKDIVVPDLRAIKITAQKYKNPLIAPVAVDGLELNWWLNQFQDDKSSLKMWAGTSRPLDMLTTYQQLMGALDENVLQHLVKVKRGKSSFGFDTRASRDALRQGYSEKEAGDAAVRLCLVFRSEEIDDLPRRDLISTHRKLKTSLGSAPRGEKPTPSE